MISPIRLIGPLFRIRMSVPLISIQSIDSPVMDSGVEKIIGSSEVWYNAVRIHNGRLQGQMSVDLLRLPLVPERNLP
jgi:hypothetical protein